MDIRLEGDFVSSYTEGDNSKVLPTDTMKNTVYVLARTLAWNCIETFAGCLANHFLTRLPQVSGVEIHIEEAPWRRIPNHDSAFFRSEGELQTTRFRSERSGNTVHSGIRDLQILKTAGSAFAGYLRDALTTLPETSDRIFATTLEANWQYADRAIPYEERRHQIHATLLDCFARHESLSVQHTLYAMAESVLDDVPDVAEVHLVMPNRHCLLVDLARFGLDNPNMIFVPTDEPSGFIEALYQPLAFRGSI